MHDAALLEVRDLVVEFRTNKGVGTAVRSVDLQVGQGEVLAVVGESGSGKTALSLSLLDLLPQPEGRIAQGSIRFEGDEVTGMSQAALRRLRGGRVAMIFQDPMTSLNPLMTVGRQIVEALQAHLTAGGRQARKDAERFLASVGIPEPNKRANDYPHRLSGGMRQRVMIAMAFACKPRLLIADEPTTALDVTVQAQILDLLRHAREHHGTGILLVTHDFGVVAEMADRVLVMYAGRKVEEGPIADIFRKPQHPYTQGLLQAMPHLPRNEAPESAETSPLAEIPGLPPSLFDCSEGCAFEPRCPVAMERCRRETPEIRTIGPKHRVACFAATPATGKKELA